MFQPPELQSRLFHRFAADRVFGLFLVVDKARRAFGQIDPAARDGDRRAELAPRVATFRSRSMGSTHTPGP
jgi:hypothetical protein